MSDIYIILNVAMPTGYSKGRVYLVVTGVSIHT